MPWRMTAQPPDAARAPLSSKKSPRRSSHWSTTIIKTPALPVHLSATKSPPSDSPLAARLQPVLRLPFRQLEQETMCGLHALVR